MSDKTALIFKSFFRTKWGKKDFCSRLKGRRARVLDVGCGNGSPQKVKLFAPDCYYVGVDVGDFNNTNTTLAYADEYLLFEPESFADEIAGLDGTFDAIISSHNIEHCNYPDKTIAAMCGKLKKDGLLYLAFPSEASTGFPSRGGGTLNFYDDPTHTYLPRFDDMIQRLESNGMEIVFSARQYRPLIYRTLGRLLEPVSRKRNKIIWGTWGYWGFETVIWAKKK